MSAKQDLPTYEDDKVRYWKNSGVLHRIGGPAIEYPNGDKEWWVNGKLHREDGPAIEWSNGIKKWYRNGVLDREDGPAIEYPDGKKIWYLRGEIFLSEKEFEKALKLLLFYCDDG